MRSFEYVAAGHVTIDLLGGDDGWECRPGGGAFYSGLQAARLGLRTLVLTQGAQAELEPLLEPYLGEITLEIAPSPHTTVLLTEGRGEHRVQHLLSWAGAMRDMPALRTDILHLAPVAKELPSTVAQIAIDTRSCGFLGITPQGLLRCWPRTGGTLSARRLRAAALPARFDAAVVNEAELAFCAPLLAAARRHQAVLAVTSGREPTRLLPDRRQLSVPAFPVAAPIEDLGAGDVFAAAFFASLAAGKSPQAAACCGNAAAHLRIRGHGAAAIGGAAAIAAVRRTCGWSRP